MSQGSIVGAIEIGTAKVVVAIGEITEGPSLNIVGVGESPSLGIIKGEVIDFKSASTATHAAISAAEDSAGVNLSQVFLAQTGNHLQGFFNEGSVNVASSDCYVSQDDINRVTNDAKSKQLSEDRVYIHHIQNPFKLDGRVITNPLNMQGQKLEVGYWSVHGDIAKVRDHIHIVNSFGLKIEDMIISSIASGSMVADETEKMNGVLVLDIGRGTTDFVVYRGGYVIQTGVVPIGGDHLTNDISLGLRIDRNEAELLKKEAANATLSDSPDLLPLNTVSARTQRSISKKALSQIVHARTEELFSIAKSQVEARCQIKDLAAGVTLTGGASRLLQIDAVARDVFETDVRLGDNPPWASDNLRHPEYSTLLGLLHYALRSKEKEGVLKVKKSGILKKVAKIFNLN